MSASMPVPPGCPSAPKLKTSISPCRPGLRYWYGLAPRVLRQPLEIAAGLPVRRHRRLRRASRPARRGPARWSGSAGCRGDRASARCMIAAMSLFAATTRASSGPLEHARHDQRREHAEDHDDDHDLDQREAACAAARVVDCIKAARHPPIIIRASCSCARAAPSRGRPSSPLRSVRSPSLPRSRRRRSSRSSPASRRCAWHGGSHSRSRCRRRRSTST